MTSFLERCTHQTTKVLSLFIGRNPQEQLPQLANLLSKVDLVLVETEDTTCASSVCLWNKQRSSSFITFDTRLELGKSPDSEGVYPLHSQLDPGRDRGPEALYQVLPFLKEKQGYGLVFGAL